MKKNQAGLKTKKRTIVGVCSSCGICCTEPIVPVTDTDVKRIIIETGLKADQIVRMYSYSDADYDPEAGLWVRLAYGKRLLGLKKKNERCMFLSDEKLCTIYKSRPLTCRTFPFQPCDDDSGGKLEINKAVKCKLKVSDAKLQRGLRKELNAEDHEDELYEKRVRKWNKINTSDKGKEDFLKFVKLL